MQSLIPKLKQISIISKKPAFLSKKLKLWRTPTTIDFIIFFWNFPHVFYLAMSTMFRSWVRNKSVKNKYVETRLFLIFVNNLRSK